MRKEWRVLPLDQGRVEQLARLARIPDVVAQLLVSRGVYDVTAAKQFLDAKLSDLRDPLDLPGVPLAVEVIAKAIRSKAPIVIYGDYDADGMTSAAILFRGLKLMGSDVSYYVPNRLEEGYGLSSAALEKLAQRGKKLVISVDCGVGSVEEAKLCKTLGMQLVITDHHRIDGELPDAAAIVHPRLPGTSYPFGELCGAGVAFKLAWALCQEICESKRVTNQLRQYLLEALALAAIGTVADVVPLVDENRILVKHGLKSLRAHPGPGVAQLMRVTKIDQRSDLQSEDIAFSIAPRLNAAGRLGQAQLGVELLTIQEETRAIQLAEYLDQLNANRVSLERSVYLAAQKQATDDYDPEADSALVLAGSGWHLGVIGVVAGRLAEKYGRPVLILSLDPVNGRPATGSGRAGGPHIDLHEALGECEHRLQKFGGHRAAAGLTLEDAQVDDFRSDFCEAVARQVAESDHVAEIKIDAEAGIGQLSYQSVRQIEQLAPFGQGNPRPVLYARGVQLAEPSRRMGGGDRHLTLRVTQDGVSIRGVAFGQGDWCEELNAHEGPFDIAYRPVINEFRGQRNVEIQLVDWRPTHAAVVGS